MIAQQEQKGLGDAISRCAAEGRSVKIDTRLAPLVVMTELECRRPTEGVSKDSNVPKIEAPGGQ